MRVFITSISLLCVVFFAVSLTLTFVASELIEAQASEFVVDRTQRLAEPIVELVERAVQTPEVVRLLDDSALQTTLKELADYRQSPRLYIARLVAAEPLPQASVTPGPSGVLMDRVLGWKQRIQDYSRRTFRALFLDLRVFTGTNLIASMVAAWYALRCKSPSARFVQVRILLLASVCFETYRYIDGFTFFKILFGTYLQWWYPVVLVVTFAGLYGEHGRTQRRPQPVAGK